MEMDRVLAPVRHRGPDHIGLHVDRQGFGLAVALLTTTTEDAGALQPVCSDETYLALDGRIDNRDELLATLGPFSLPLPSGRTQESDAEIVMRAFQRWGDEFAAQLVGDFVAVVWQAARRRLLIARDVTGQRSLLYFSDARLLVFGTELAQVLGHPEVSAAPNERVVAEYLRCDLSSQEETLYQGVRRLLPAHYLIAEAGQLRQKRYWSIDPNRKIRYEKDADYAEHLLEVLQVAVTAQCRSLGPVGTTLSGGLDSSSVTALAAEQVPGLRAYSLVFPGRECDESAFIDEVVKKSDIACHRVDGTQLRSNDPRLEAALYRDVPDYPNAAMHGEINRLARTHGCRVILSGAGGDELWSGALTYAADLLKRGHPIQSLRRSLSDRRVESFWYPRWGYLRYGVLPVMPDFMRRSIGAVQDWRHERAGWLGPRLRGLRSRSQSMELGSCYQNEMWTALISGWAAQGNESGERFYARYQIEHRAPFMDRRVLEAGFAMPEEQKRRGELSKQVLREALTGRMPSAVRSRASKSDFGDVVGQSINDYGHLLKRPAIVRHGWLEQAAVDLAYSDWLRAPRKGLLRLWMALAIECWFQTLKLDK